MSEKDTQAISLRSLLCEDECQKTAGIYATGSWNGERVAFTFSIPHAGAWTWRFYTGALLKTADIVCRMGEGAPLKGAVAEGGEETSVSFALPQAGEVSVSCSLCLPEGETHGAEELAGALRLCALAQRERELQESLRIAEENCRALEEQNKVLTNRCDINEDVAASLEQLEDRERELEEECLQLRGKENELKNEITALRRSRSWRVAQAFASVLRFFVPVGSKRALFCRLLWAAVRHPIKVLKNLSPRKIRKFVGAWRRGDIEGAKAMLHSGMTGEVTPASIEVIAPVVEQVDLREKSFEDYPVLRVPQWDEPEVSIIIPVYNQFEFTYHCVSSLLKYSGSVHMEILIANDCSTDLTTRAEEILPGVRLITNEENLRFLRNCNHATQAARGKYVLFLNNDTQVQRNWLRPLLALIESAPDVGMVGSKLIYPDGRLQEAGGILWQDGSAWNFGSRQNPRMPEFNYVKEVDYISGAAIMLRRSLWEEIGGFDETFAPAYCEDSDLAFTIRKMGYRVLYQPCSVVVHFEGVSNGTDTAAGQKKYQVDNQEKFRAKWADELARHPKNGDNVFQARDRSYGKKTLVMVDHYVPTYDKDAGSRTVFQYLKLFVEQGYNVKFIGDNFRAAEPYTTTLQQMGVEILYGAYYADHWRDWVRQNAEKIDYVFLNRPHIAPKYLDFFRENTKAKIVYYGHDLVFLREMREFEVTHDPALKESAQSWQPKELSLMKQADMAYYPSEVEVEEIHRIDPTVGVKAIPGYIFESARWEGYDFEQRRDIMFIGGFSHRPNIDAVKWLAQEILPALLERLPEVVVHVLGSNAPKEVLAMQSEHLVIEGFVSDEKLAWFYRHMRLSLVPLRYGAGIKGKVIEAIQFGTPVVTTPTGIEGIIGAEDLIAVAEEAPALAQTIASLYNDPQRLTDMSRGSAEYINTHYAKENALRAIGEEFDFIGKENV